MTASLHNPTDCRNTIFLQVGTNADRPKKPMTFLPKKINILT